MMIIFIDEGEDELIIIPLVLLIAGPLCAWISSFFMYGFGELIDKACDIERNTRGGQVKSAVQTRIDAERFNQLENLRAKGLISEGEYQQAVSKNS